MKSFLEWVKVNESRISQMSVNQIVSAGPNIMADAASNLLMWLNMGIEDKDALPNPLEARRLKSEIDAFLSNYPKIVSQKSSQNHPFPAAGMVINPSERNS